MEEENVRNAQTTISNDKTQTKTVCKSTILQSSLIETSLMDTICDKIVGINVSTNNFVTNSESSLNYEQLDLLSESEPEKVFSTLINNINFKSTLNTCLDITVLIHLMNIFSQLLQLNVVKTIVLDMLQNSKYLENFNNSLNDVTKLNDLICNIKMQEFFTNCKTILEFIVNPKSKALLNEIMQSKCIKSNGMDIKELECIDDDLETDNMMQMLNEVEIDKCCYVVQKWPQMYKNLTAHPVSADILSNKILLSPTIMNGSYDNVDHYLDVQFRLLREDFIAPLREGIQYYKTMNEHNLDVKKIPNIHMYFGVKIKEKVSNNQQNLFTVHFYTKEDCSINSKKFMSESLLIFSNDNFYSMFFAIVIKMYENTSLSKTLLIKLVGDQVTIKLSSFYIMAESMTYFLPYKYAMNVLKKFNFNNFPMKSYIVYGKTKSQIPAYLTNNSKIYSIKGLRFDILNDNLWPDKPNFGLDSAQYTAFKAALTEEFTIIQGPPGTGKTFIGLRITRSIIENLYGKHILKNPVLVVCYTNHALDQFLEGLIKITSNIVRIGGGCKSDILKPYVVGNIQNSYVKNYLMDSHVIGLTTTGASMRHSLLMDLKPSIVIIEEAAEVLESHVVASLTKFCKHVILIGDHKQLRPRTASFILSKKFYSDVSLFERLVNNGFPCYTLATQYRMRPEISTLMQPIYPFLKDHKSVEDRSNIRGVTKNVYFIHHEVKEEKVIESSSYKNMHEVFFFTEFARYLFKQGYHQSQVTILVTYQEQLLELQKIRENSLCLEDFRIECVDGYQGEENDIILLSLVRNNVDNKIGFLNIQNRICVALSRARNGLYIMGNVNNLTQSSIWKEICCLLTNQQSLGDKLTLNCEIHKDWTTTVSNSNDIAKVQCTKKCNIKLDCGHRCPQFCHYYDQSHKTIFRCKKHYLKTLSCGYKIEIECWMRFLTFECPKVW